MRRRRRKRRKRKRGGVEKGRDATGKSINKEDLQMRNKKAEKRQIFVINTKTFLIWIEISASETEALAIAVAI